MGASYAGMRITIGVPRGHGRKRGGIVGDSGKESVTTVATVMGEGGDQIRGGPDREFRGRGA